MALSREVFKESYKAFSEAVGRDIEDKKALEDYKNELYGIIRSVEATAKELGERGLAILNKYGLKVTDFKGGSRSPLTLLDRLVQGEMKEPSATLSVWRIIWTAVSRKRFRSVPGRSSDVPLRMV